MNVARAEQILHQEHCPCRPRFIRSSCAQACAHVCVCICVCLCKGDGELPANAHQGNRSRMEIRQSIKGPPGTSKVQSKCCSCQMLSMKKKHW